MAANIEARLVAFGFARFRSGRRLLGAALDRAEVLLDLPVAGLDLVLIHLIELAGLTQGKEVFLAPVAHQGLGDGGDRGLDTAVSQRGQTLRVAFAGKNGVDDRQSGDAGQVADDVMQNEGSSG